MTSLLTFGGWLKRRRQELGLTQKELARRVGYAAVTLRKVEAGELRPSAQMARKLAEALELAPEEQAQFVRFARDQLHADTPALPVHAAPLPPARTTPVARVGQEQPGLADMIGLSAVSPARTRPKHNLPAQTTPLIGRQEDLAELAQLLADTDSRLVTIVSAGGMGKTHLAVAAAAQQANRFAAGACWVPLAPLTEPNEVVLAIAAALGIQLQGERTAEQQLGDYLQGKHLLLVLDNFEHLLPSAPLVGELLSRAPQLWILATSRQRLNLSSETVLFLDGLPFPAAGDPAAPDAPAVQMFLLHARRLHPQYRPDGRDLAGIVAVCRLVYGMPLGILLAAAWSRVLSPPEIAAEIGRDLGFLHTEMLDVPARQRNLRAVFLHTWSRLTPAERAVFVRLSVFRGGATAEAARQVAGATLDVLAGLVDKALLRPLPNGRYEIHELLRQFAAEQLAGAAKEGEQNDAQRQHGAYYLNLLAGQEQRLQSPEQRTALDIIQIDYENINAAWRLAVQRHAFAGLGPAVHPLFLYCEVRGMFRAGMVLFADAAAELATALAASAGGRRTSQVLWGRLTVRLGACEVLLGNYGRGEQLLLDGLPHIAEDWERAFGLMYLGQAASERGELALARTRLEESTAISRQCNHFALMAQAMHILEVGRPHAEAQRLAAESLALARKAERPDLVALRLNDLGWHTWCLGDHALADACWQEGIVLCDQLGLRGENAWPLDCLGFAAWCRGDMASAEHYIAEALAIYTEVGRQAHIGMCMAELALVLASTGRVQQAVALGRQAVATTRNIDGQMMLIISLDYLGAVLLAAGEFEEARVTLLEAIRRAWDQQYLFSLMIAFYYFAELLLLESHHVGPEGALERKRLAVALLSRMRTEPATWRAFQDKAEVLQARIKCDLPAALYRSAVAAGQNQAVGQLVNTLLGSSRAEPALGLPRTSGAGAASQAEASSRVQFETLTARELTVLQLVAAGRSNREIAAELVITTGTAKYHVSHILGKLGVQSRTQAIARGRELGLLV